MPPVAVAAAVIIASWNTYNGVMAIYDRHFKDTDGDGTIDSEDPEPKNPDVPKKQEKEETENITAESEAGAMMLVDTNAFELMSYNLLRQYKIQYRHVSMSSRSW